MMVFTLSAATQINYKTYELSVDFSSPSQPYPNYWNNSGFTPGDLLFRKDMQLNLQYQAAIPRQGMVYMRPHWLLNMTTVQGHDTGDPVYNFENLFKALDEFVKNDMKLIFEIMGFPTIAGTGEQVTYDEFAQGQSGNVPQWIPDFEKKTDYLQWYEFVKTLITALEDRYGVEELKSWYFECTNEPDIHSWFWKQGIPALLNYWDATSEAIKSVNPDYKFGGPGNATVLSDEFKAVLAHCDTGTNAITGEKGAVLDYISAHSKNLPYAMVDMEIRSIEYIRENHPRFRDIPFWNNEADPTWGWARPFWWRPRSWYAAFIIQSVDAHNRIIIDSLGVNFKLLSNDKAFLGNWYHRTDHARFHKEENKDEFWMIKKPALNVMTLLSLSAGERFDVNGFPTTRENTSVIASKTPGGEYVLLIANMPEFGPVRTGADSDKVITPDQIMHLHDQGSLVDITLEELGIDNPVFTHVKLDDIHGNPYAVWNSLDKPENPGREEYHVMAANMEPVILEHQKMMTGKTLSFSMAPASVSMIIISEKEDNPGSSEVILPVAEDIKTYTGFNGERKEFIRWQPVNDKIVAYNIHVSYDGGEFTKLNPTPLLDAGFLHVFPEGKKNAEYRVSAFDL